MWFFIVLFALCIVGVPTLWIWVWRGKYLPKNDVGTRLELHREQALRSAKTIAPTWLMIVLIETDHIIHLFPVSRDFRLFWLGFLAASILFNGAWAMANFIPLIRQERQKRQQRIQRTNVV